MNIVEPVKSVGLSIKVSCDDRVLLLKGGDY